MSPPRQERKYPKQPVVAVGAAIVKDGRALLIQRGQEPGLGNWTLPGGLLEVGETLRAGVAREVSEECGLEIQVGDIIYTGDRIIRDQDGNVLYHFVIVDFAAQWLSGEPRPASDIAQVRWVRPDEIGEPLIKDIVLRAMERDRGAGD